MSSQNGFISLPLVKFSYTTDIITETKFNWVHVTRDLFLVVDSFRSGSSMPDNLPEGAKLMKVIQGIDILESVNIEAQIKRSHVFISHARELKTSIKMEQLPTVALFRQTASTVALRYPAPDEKVRRIQLKFKNNEDFLVAYGALESLGCPMSSAEATKKPEPKGPSCPPSALDSLKQPSMLDKLKPSGYTSSLDSGQLSSYANLRSNEGLTITRDPISEQSSNNLANPTQNHRGFSTPYTRNASHSLTLPKQNEADVSSVDGISSSRFFEHHSGSYHPHASRPQSSDSNNYPRFAESIDSPSKPISTNISGILEWELPPISKPPVQVANRPTEMNKTRSEETLSQIIPPRRELPFARSMSSLNSRRPTSAVDLPPLPTPTMINKIPSFGEMQRPASHSLCMDKNTTEQAFQTPDTDHSDSNSKSLLQRDQMSQATAHSIESRPVTRANHLDASLASHPDPTTYTHFSSAPSIQRPSTRDELCSSTLNGQSPSSPRTERQFNAIKQSAAASLGHAQTSPSLADYATLPYDDRMGVIESMIVRLIEDDNFLTFCEDVNGCWRRIGLNR